MKIISDRRYEKYLTRGNADCHVRQIKIREVWHKVNIVLTLQTRTGVNHYKLTTNINSAAEETLFKLWFCVKTVENILTNMKFLRLLNMKQREFSKWVKSDLSITIAEHPILTVSESFWRHCAPPMKFRWCCEDCLSCGRPQITTKM